MDGSRRALLVAAADAAEAGRAGRDSVPARRWIERTLSALVPRGARLDETDGVVCATAAACVRLALEVSDASSGSDRRVATAIHAGTGELRPRTRSLLAAAHGGQTVLTAEAAKDAFDDLPDGLTIRSLGPHLLDDLSPPGEIHEVGVDVSFPPLRSMDVLKHNLPVQPTSLVGRADTIADVASKVSRHSVVTLTGPGGVGKTRVAVQAAAAAGHRFPDGVTLVELAALTDPSRLDDHLAGALGIGGRIEDGLRRLHLLVVLDNCEQLVDACARLVAGVTRGCPGVRFLVTSREPLGVTGEAIVAIAPLETDGEAVRLFTERATLSAPGFTMTDDDTMTVAEICRRLDGLPLAIELAAPHLRRMSVRDLAGRLDDRLRVLSDGPRDADPRHRSLEGLVDWSYRLLDETQRTVFARLSVFAGGFDLDAARTVCAGDHVTPDDVAAALARLVDRSLVTASTSGPSTRYGMLETIRSFAAERLDHRDDVMEKLLSWASDLVQRAEAQMWGEHRMEWFSRLDAERANVETALRWALDSGRTTAAVEMVALFAHHWGTHGRVREGRAWLEEALSSEHEAEPDRAAQALRIAAWFAFTQGDLEHARRRYTEAVRASGHPLDVVHAQLGLAEVERALGHPDETRRLVEASVAVARDDGNLVLLYNAIGALAGLASDDGDTARARELYAEALGAARRRGDRFTMAVLLGDLAGATDGPEARRLLEEACALHRESGNRPGLARALCRLAVLAREKGDEAVSLKAASEALALAREAELPEVEARCSDILGAPAAPGPSRRTFRRDGAKWQLSDGEKTFYLKHGKGLGYLAALLVRPGVEIHCLQLLGTKPPDPATVRALDDLRELLDDAERTGDAMRAAQLRVDIEAQTERLVFAAGHDAERARQSVTKAIKDALKRIATYSPALAHHLSIRVRTGLYCCYLAGPGEDASWDL